MDYWYSGDEIANFAAEMEAKAVAFYNRLQQIARDAKVSDMCVFFAEQEAEHKGRFRTIAEQHRASSKGERCYSVGICGMLKTSVRDMERFLAGVIGRKLDLAVQATATIVSVEQARPVAVHSASPFCRRYCQSRPVSSSASAMTPGSAAATSRDSSIPGARVAG